jgi:hypothetical protein
MSLDDRIRRELDEAVASIDHDPREVVERLLPMGRRRRTRRRIVQAAAGAMAAAGLVVGGFQLLPGMVLVEPGGPTPGPSSSPIVPSPGPPTPARPGCISFNVSNQGELRDARKECGLLPAELRVEGGAAYRLTAPSGETFWAVFHDDVRVNTVMTMPDVLMRVEGVPIRDNPVGQFFTTDEPREAVRLHCAGEPECDPQVVESEVLPNGAILARWEDRSGTAPLEVTSVDLGTWLAVLPDHDTSEVTERIARALQWREDEDGYLLVSSSDPDVSIDHDWSSLRVGIGTNRGFFWGRILPDCRLSEKRPDLGGNDYGPGLTFGAGTDAFPPSAHWCADGYAVDVDGATLEETELIYRGLQVTATLPPGP